MLSPFSNSDSAGGRSLLRHSIRNMSPMTWLIYWVGFNGESLISRLGVGDSTTAVLRTPFLWVVLVRTPHGPPQTTLFQRVFISRCDFDRLLRSGLARGSTIQGDRYCACLMSLRGRSWPTAWIASSLSSEWTTAREAVPQAYRLLLSIYRFCMQRRDEPRRACRFRPSCTQDPPSESAEASLRGWQHRYPLISTKSQDV